MGAGRGLIRQSWETIEDNPDEYPLMERIEKYFGGV
jgi:hypothetical protein